ncbi:MAG: hypothetical protein AAF567_14570 [Actinomycetota bacterium]
MAVVDIATFVADLKDLAADHGFHVHDERHFVETYSMRQAWEVDLHPAHACGGPLDMHISLEVEPRTMLSFEDVIMSLPEGEEPPDDHLLPLTITWSMPPLQASPDLLELATEMAGIGGPELSLEISAADAFVSVIDAPQRSVNIVSRSSTSLSRLFMGQEDLSDLFRRLAAVSDFLLDRARVWLGDL